MFDKLKSAPAGIADRAKRTKDSLGRAKEGSSKSLSSGKERSHQVLEKHWPTIERVLTNGLVGAAEDKLRDEVFLQNSFEKVYELLPVAVRFLVNRDKFIGYCMSHREPILLRLETSRSVEEVPNALEHSAKEEKEEEANYVRVFHGPDTAHWGVKL